MNDPLNAPGWYFLGQFESGVGSWLLRHRGEALLLEVPEGLAVKGVCREVARLGLTLRHVTASHQHWDHLDGGVWKRLKREYPRAHFHRPAALLGSAEVCDTKLRLGGEPVYLVSAPKHSACDVVTVFRGVAMTGDIELGTLESVCNEVPLARRRRSMAWLKDFPGRNGGYRVHTVISAHLDDVRRGVDWKHLFTA